MKTIRDYQRETACNFTKYVAELKDYKCRSKKMRGLRESARKMIEDNGGYFYGNSVDLWQHFQDAFKEYGLKVGAYANSGYWGLYYNSTFKTIRFVVI